MIIELIANLKPTAVSTGGYSSGHDSKKRLEECCTALSTSTEEVPVLDLNNLSPAIIDALLNALIRNPAPRIRKIQLDVSQVTAASAVLIQLLQTNCSLEEFQLDNKAGISFFMCSIDAVMAELINAIAKNPATAIRRLVGFELLVTHKADIALRNLLLTNRSLIVVNLNWLSDETLATMLDAIAENPYSAIRQIEGGTIYFKMGDHSFAAYQKLLKKSRAFANLNLSSCRGFTDQQIAALIKTAAENPHSALEEFNLDNTHAGALTAIALREMLTVNRPRIIKPCSWSNYYGYARFGTDEAFLRKTLDENIARNQERVSPVRVRGEQGKLNWSRLAVAASFFRSNRANDFVTSVLPVIQGIQDMMGIDTSVLTKNSYMHASSFIRTRYFRAITSEIETPITLTDPTLGSGYCHIFNVPPVVRNLSFQYPGYVPVLYQNETRLIRYDDLELIQGLGGGIYSIYPPHELGPKLFYVAATDNRDILADYRGTSEKVGDPNQQRTRFFYRIIFEPKRSETQHKLSSATVVSTAVASKPRTNPAPVSAYQPPPVKLAKSSPEMGNCHVVGVPDFVRKVLMMHQDLTLRLYENDKPLMRVDNEVVIRSQGGGRYFAWPAKRPDPQLIYFAASDNSNPQTNGKTYQLRFERLGLKPIPGPTKLGTPTHEMGHCYVLSIPTDIQTVLLERPDLVPVLYENGNRLTGISSEKSIRNGEAPGCYYAWGHRVPEIFYFAAMNNGNPQYAWWTTYQLHLETKAVQNRFSDSSSLATACANAMNSAHACSASSAATWTTSGAAADVKENSERRSTGAGAAADVKENLERRSTSGTGPAPITMLYSAKNITNIPKWALHLSGLLDRSLIEGDPEVYTNEIKQLTEEFRKLCIATADSKENVEFYRSLAVAVDCYEKRKTMKSVHQLKLMTEFSEIYNLFKCPVTAKFPEVPVRILRHPIPQGRRQLYNQESVIQVITQGDRKCPKTQATLDSLTDVSDSGVRTVKADTLKSADILLYVFALAAEEWIKTLTVEERQIKELPKTASADEKTAHEVFATCAADIHEAEKAIENLWKTIDPGKKKTAEEIFMNIKLGNSAAMATELNDDEVGYLGFLIPSALERRLIAGKGVASPTIAGAAAPAPAIARQMERLQ